jgi:outer membrane protein assembly factor BamB
MKMILIAAALSAAIVVPAAADPGHGKGKAKGHTPAVIELPQNFEPEGIATGKRHTFFVGSRTTGAIYRGSLRTGDGEILVEGGPDVAGDDRAATGLKVDRYGRLFASGADSKHIRVYDAQTGDQLRDYFVGADAGFINDVIVTKRGAYFTDSNNAWLYFIPFGQQGSLGDLTRIPLGGGYANSAGFNANGIVAARGGKSLIVVKSNTGELFDVDAATGFADRIEVTGGDGELINADGMLLKGRKLYVVENRDDPDPNAAGVGVISVVKLARNLASGRIAATLHSELFQVPTTIARSGGRNYVVNAKFGLSNPDGSFEVVKVPKR